ncbi:MAG: HAD-IIIC family phosphatase [Lachnospiraceae bacterium]|nr:HAD-IIIC family phosphatase [Lachnospiraceae bacterium]
MQELEYPFDSDHILKKSKKILRQLREEMTGMSLVHKKVAVLGGSTTHDIIRILELFLLNEGVEVSFYEADYGNYWQEAMFDNPKLQDFAPDIIYIHTSGRNITAWPSPANTGEQVEELLTRQYNHFTVMWDRLQETYHCPIIQNNFEYPYFRLMGNREAGDIHGRVYFTNRLNMMFANYALTHENFHLHDINYLSAAYGLDHWADPFYWHMYKYALNIKAIPDFAFNLAHIIKSLCGRNKKGLVLDLDNTLWGGVVGDDGPEQLEIGPETSMGQVYGEFQRYIQYHKQLGIILTVNSKNDPENALAGLNHPDGCLRPDDFVVIKANWEAKSANLLAIAEELGVLPESLVFVDDNPAEREIVRRQVPEATVPEMTPDSGTKERTPDQYIRILDKNGYFEVTGWSEDDQKRNEMYQANVIRQRQEAQFEDYQDYLLSLEMKATIKAFEPVYLARIAQLTNKSNQFNLTTMRLSQNEIEGMAADDRYVTLYGKLVDKFGDNGVVSVVIGHKEEGVLHLRLWLMSCRVLKRDMEYAMMDAVVAKCQEEGVSVIRGYYYKTAKNSMVRDFYQQMGFVKMTGDQEGNTTWEFIIPPVYERKNKTITV